tara:strand:+ start:238 stop:495 length:258 start_codon:yes stop_codon:yes gene_type:complete
MKAFLWGQDWRAIEFNKKIRTLVIAVCTLKVRDGEKIHRLFLGQITHASAIVKSCGILDEPYLGIRPNRLNHSIKVELQVGHELV